MSLTIKHLNGDTTFLLTFTPYDYPSYSRLSHQSPQPLGSFSILLDPWLKGPAKMWHHKFLLSKHTSPSWIDHLSQIPEPNVVVVTQDKPDHCHEPTLRELDPESPITMILAEPSAAKRIRGMKHFDPSRVHDLRTYSHKNYDSVIRFCVPPIVPGGSAGEATISFIPAKMDVAGVHNAIGITYRPPSVMSIPARPLTPHMPPSFQHAASPPPHSLSSRPMTPPDSPLPGSLSHTSSTGASSNPSSSFSMPSHARSISSTSSVSSSIRYPPQTERSLSLIYSPHGVSYQLLRSYGSSHLVPNAALPLTALLHSFDRVDNPWWMGGNVAAGSRGGVEIARNLMARCWISAHDEDKDNTGISVANVKKTKHSLREVIQDMAGTRTQVMTLGVGEEYMMKAL